MCRFHVFKHRETRKWKLFDIFTSEAAQKPRSDDDNVSKFCVRMKVEKGNDRGFANSASLLMHKRKAQNHWSSFFLFLLMFKTFSSEPERKEKERLERVELGFCSVSQRSSPSISGCLRHFETEWNFDIHLMWIINQLEMEGWGDCRGSSRILRRFLLCTWNVES